MKRTRSAACFALGLVVAGGDAMAQAATNAALFSSNPESSAAKPETGEKDWSFSVSMYGYFVPDSRDYVQPTMTADRGRLHLEARYNYEDVDTGSVWIGYNFSVGDTLSLEFTPMLGSVFGSSSGFAPGYKATLSWSQLELYTEGEYVFDSVESSDSFFYTWSELTFAPVSGFRIGMVVQRTALYQSDFSVQRGLLAAFSHNALELTACIFNPDANQPVAVLGVGWSF